MNEQAKFLIVNPKAGSSTPSASELVAAAERAGVRCHVLRDGEDASGVARASRSAVIGVAGGDGSLASVAAVAVQQGVPFVCIPFGTRNHFARDLGLDAADPIGMLRSFDGQERQVDLGVVAGRPFLNNASFGMYADLVHRRERRRRRREVFAGGRALWRVLRRRPRLTARLDGREVRTSIIFVANNRYDLSLFTVGERPVLDEGKLHLYTAGGWFPTGWRDSAAARFELELPSGHVRAALDGDPVLLDSSGPLVFESRARALRVLSPPSP